MFELLRKEPDGSNTLLRIFADDQQEEIDRYIHNLEIEKAFQEYRKHAEVMGIGAATRRALSLINLNKYVTLRIG